MLIKSVLPFLTLLLSISIYPILCNNNTEEETSCINLKFSISQNVENEGFHREINWLIESLDLDNEDWSNLNNSLCKVSLQLHLPSGIFVSPDQISELIRQGQISAYIDGHVNVETPAHESEGHTVYVYIASNNLEKVVVQLPIHLRYQRAVISGGFGKVNLPRPSLLVYCPQVGPQICGEFPKLHAPCDVSGNHCVWQNVTYQALFDEVQLFVPIGDLDDYPLVSIVTLLLGCAGSIYILSLLSTAPL
ncbi:hypothetical protein ILUMI_13297 [Ignelater luminosus]|uniref:Phosphatidylinositol-glycan biosynthesis class X protein n=1 Tax=Ignelater luminosus TaxID=2038154 RepID=A0A8K0CSN3_IGNLU|nr:hypothetical protein ILUMI_13297 [Ignelater luminosus]